MLVFDILKRLNCHRCGLVDVQNGQGGDRHVARLEIAFRLAKRLERLHGLGATDFADGVDRRLTHRRGGFPTTGEPG